ncbi:unnamed protein product [Adineta steineri]|uniref:Uncharacterized protein n=1 Tax=Adineta steineri TaxID=433720 RepID=A0A815SW77_9BILA|nr:unnamed protein product [Adineta steineri]CAF1493290.1 unnamed protein product [Adineta steineri]
MARLALQLCLLVNILVMVTSLFMSTKLKAPTTYEMKQKLLTVGTSSYTIKDKQGTPLYKIGFKTIGLGKHLQLTDYNTGKEYYAIKHILNPLGLAKYEIRQNDRVIADVKRKVKLLGLGTKFTVTSKLGTYKINGKFRSRDFKIKKDAQLVATISKKFFHVHDTYGIKIENGQDVPFILSLAVVLDEVLHD